MSAASGRHSLRARIAEALASLLNAKAHRELGRILGVSGTTVTNRGTDLHNWPTDELLELAVLDEAVGAAIASYLRDDAPATRGEAVAVHAGMVLELQDSAQVDAAVLSNLDRATPIGRETIRAMIAIRRQHEDKLLMDLLAMDRVSL